MGRPKRTAAERGAKRVRELLDQDNDSKSLDTDEPSDSSVSATSVATISSSDESDSDSTPIEIPPSKKKGSKISLRSIPKSEKEDEEFGEGNEDLGKEEEGFVILSTDEDELTLQPNERVLDRQTQKLPKSRASRKAQTRQAKKDDNSLTERYEWQEWEAKWEVELGSHGPWGDDSGLDCNVSSAKESMSMKEPPPELLMSLLPFQKEWLWWSVKQEASEIRGGILADEMGMGKTIQAIALILTNRAKSLPQSSGGCSGQTLPGAHLDKPTNEPPEIKATLVVCPLVAVIQWRNEIARFTKEGSVKVLVYHGSKRCKDISELAEYDIVLTTYSIVELEHRLTVMPAKEPCKWCGKLFYPDRMSVHLRFFCGPDARKTEKQAKQLKKKCVKFKAKPKSSGKLSMMEKPDEIAEECGDALLGQTKQGKGRRGRKRKIQEEELEEAVGVAMESLPEVATSQRSAGSSRGLSLLHAVKWNRVVLDEAHSIKDRRCSTAKAVFALKSNFKWALSGTPLQNRVGELYSLVRFLEIKPFSYYYCKKCDCKSLDYSFGKQWRKCDHCNHSPLHHFCWWNKYIANPIKKWGYINDGRRAMTLLQHKLLDSTLLRRTKLERAADLALPPSTKFLRRDAFDAREEDFYQALYTQSQSQFNTYIDAGTLLNNYAHIFDLLTRLRQAVDHPYLVVYSRTALQSSSQPDGAVEALCGICNDPLEEAVTTACKHSFCRACILEYVSAAGSDRAPPCPTCQNALTVDLTGSKVASSEQTNSSKVKGYKRSSILNRINLTEFQSSTKIDALREEIAIMLQKDCAAKAIVFSQFTSFLDLIGFRLEKCGIKCVKLDGSMSMMARDQMIESFTNDPDCKVFLMSLKAGGVALNLTVASHVFLMDPWWNPAVEQQAQDRIHRLGQYKPIRIVRFVIENTIEERILKLQEKKQLVFEGTVGGSTEALGRLTEQDMRFLFTS